MVGMADPLRPRIDETIARFKAAGIRPLMLTGDQPGPGHLDLKTAGVGKPMLVNVFASWCGPCRAEHPRLMALKAQGVQIVGVALRDEPEATRAFLDEMGDPYTRVLVDADGKADGIITDPGAPGHMALSIVGLAPDVGSHPFWF